MNKLFEFDREFKNNSSKIIVGVDEVGRGPGAGPVCACAYLFYENFENLISQDEKFFLQKLNDSKKLSIRNREILSEILKKCGKYSIFTVDENKIDEINILNATFLAMKSAITAIAEIELDKCYFLVDGNKKIKDFDVLQKTIVKGDSKSASIAAASVMAKVFRDNLMIHLSKKYPQYSWDKNKGYLTKVHIEAIKKYGASKHHRKTFIKNFVNN